MLVVKLVETLDAFAIFILKILEIQFGFLVSYSQNSLLICSTMPWPVAINDFYRAIE